MDSPWKEPVRGGHPDPSLFGSSGLDQLRAMLDGHVPQPPIGRLTGFKQQLASMALAPRALLISAVLVSVMATVVMPLLTVAVSRGRIHTAPRVTPRTRRRLAAGPPAHRGSG